MINVLPALGLLRRRRPADRLSFVVEDRAADVVRGHPFLDEVIVFPRRRWREMLRGGTRGGWRELARELAAYRRALRARGFDVALDFQGNAKGALHALASGARRRIGFAAGHDREAAHLFATERVVPPPDRPHRVEKFASLLGPLGVGRGELSYALPEDPAADARVAGRLAASGLGPGSRFVLVHPGTSDRGAEKRWPAERFGALAAEVRSALGLPVLASFGPGEEALAAAVAAASGGAARTAPATASLLELAALLRRASAFVSADTGPMHLAAASGTRCVALFGPKDPAVYRPWGEGHRVVRADAPGAGPAPMAAIAVGDVFAALADVLGGRAR